MITVTSLTLELTQTLESGERQTIIVEVNDTDEIVQTDAWTNGIVGFSDIIATATSCLSHAKLRIASIEEGLI
jgi:hypothetical protein